MEKNEIKNDLFGVCPFVTVQKILSGKWNIMIIYLLSKKKYRFGELQRELGVITQTTLTKQLRLLEDYGIIDRKIYQEIPPKVEYSLTNLGKEFLPVLDVLKAFGEKYILHLSSIETRNISDEN